MVNFLVHDYLPLKGWGGTAQYLIYFLRLLGQFHMKVNYVTF